MHIESFDDLLQAARQQPDPQRLLFVFAAAEIPDGATDEQRRAFEAGHGGELTPRMCVDKLPEEVESLASLADEAPATAAPWTLVFVAGLGGDMGRAPTSADAEAPLRRMVASIQAGRLAGMLPFDRQGLPVRLR